MRDRRTAVSQDEGDIVVIGVGNPFRRDDGVGRRVARLIQPRISGRATVRECEGEATELMDAWTGHAHALVVDAARGSGTPGTIHRIELGDGTLPAAIGGTSVHGLGLAEAIELGRALGRIPGRLIIYAVEGSSFDIGAGLSAEVESAVEEVSRRVLAEIEVLRERSGS